MELGFAGRVDPVRPEIRRRPDGTARPVFETVEADLMPFTLPLDEPADEGFVIGDLGSPAPSRDDEQRDDADAEFRRAGDEPFARGAGRRGQIMKRRDEEPIPGRRVP